MRTRFNEKLLGIGVANVTRCRDIEKNSGEVSQKRHNVQYQQLEGGLNQWLIA
jgi:hypothetical protein